MGGVEVEKSQNFNILICYNCELLGYLDLRLKFYRAYGHASRIERF